ncbi:hypothetical protein [Streptomyces sp. NBC_00354]|uniref:hypothetical protein n=1 Tax=Streptomyces sp. NBC_00354 TaxID=2975723 RepID=UPI002E261638|nr:hypothetical protein OG296_13355 [Streptomyces sp. NBC_01001]
MNRHRRLALVAPLLASSIALPPAVATAQGPPDRMPVSHTAPLAPVCSLKAAPGTDPVEFDLVLTGFKPGDPVKITGPKEYNGVTSPQGAFDEENVPRGNYTVTTGQGGAPQQKTGCEKPPRPPVTPPTGITEATVELDSPAFGVNCNVPHEVRVDGTLEGGGSGRVKYVWTSGTGKRTEKTMRFPGFSTRVDEFSVTAPARTRPQDPAPTVTVQLTVPKQGGQAAISSEVLPVTLKCL